LTKKEREIFRRMGRKGGKNKAAKMTAAERSALGKKAINARWKKAREAAALKVTA